MTENGEVLVSWEDFNNNLSKGIHDSLNHFDFMDVTLMAEGQFIRAHRLILSITSRYMQKIFTEIPSNKEAFIFLKDVKFEILNEIIKYIYCGKVSLKQGKLSDFISTAEALQIKGFDKKIQPQQTGALMVQKCQKTQYSQSIVSTRSTGSFEHPQAIPTFQDQNYDSIQLSPPVVNKRLQPIERAVGNDPNLHGTRDMGNMGDILETIGITSSDFNCSNVLQDSVLGNRFFPDGQNNDSYFLELRDGQPVAVESLHEDSETQTNNNADETIRSFPFSVINDQLKISSYAESYLGSPAPKPHAPIQTGLSKRIPKFLQNRTLDDWHDIKYETTERGNILNLQGHRFYKQHSFGPTDYWRCAKSRLNCKVRVKISKNNPKVYKISGVHNHSTAL